MSRLHRRNRQCDYESFVRAAGRGVIDADGSLCGADQIRCVPDIKKYDKHVMRWRRKSMAKVQVMDHPLIQHKMNCIRREELVRRSFR